MSLKINYPKKFLQKTNNNLVLFSDEKFNTSRLKKYISNSEINYINGLIKSIDLKKSIFVFEINSKKKIVLVSIKKNLKASQVENLGAEFFAKINQGKNSDYNIFSDSISANNEIFLSHFLHGIKLKSYEFKKYKTKKNSRLIQINVIGTKNKPSTTNQLKFKALEEGTFLLEI